MMFFHVLLSGFAFPCAFTPFYLDTSCCILRVHRICIRICFAVGVGAAVGVGVGAVAAVGVGVIWFGTFALF